MAGTGERMLEVMRVISGFSGELEGMGKQASRLAVRLLALEPAVDRVKRTPDAFPEENCLTLLEIAECTRDVLDSFRETSSWTRVLQRRFYEREIYRLTSRIQETAPIFGGDVDDRKWGEDDELDRLEDIERMLERVETMKEGAREGASKEEVADAIAVSTCAAGVENSTTLQGSIPEWFVWLSTLCSALLSFACVEKLLAGSSHGVIICRFFTTRVSAEMAGGSLPYIPSVPSSIVIRYLRKRISCNTTVPSCYGQETYFFEHLRCVPLHAPERTRFPHYLNNCMVPSTVSLAAETHQKAMPWIRGLGTFLVRRLRRRCEGNGDTPSCLVRLCVRVEMEVLCRFVLKMLRMKIPISYSILNNSMMNLEWRLRTPRCFSKSAALLALINPRLIRKPSECFDV